MSSNNNNKECRHIVLSVNDRSCTVCGMSRYDQLQNTEKGLTKAEEKELEGYINRKHWELID
jgi:hypothetical protein